MVPTLPVHQGCAATHSMTSWPSAAVVDEGAPLALGLAAPADVDGDEGVAVLLVNRPSGATNIPLLSYGVIVTIGGRRDAPLRAAGRRRPPARRRRASGCRSRRPASGSCGRGSDRLDEAIVRVLAFSLISSWLLLHQHPRVTDVLWPGLPEHPGHGIAARQMRDFGGMVSFLLESEEEAVDLVARTDAWTLAESLGGVESLIEHPARMTHASTATGPFAAPPNLVRLSVGIESADDLVEDLAKALAAMPARA